MLPRMNTSCVLRASYMDVLRSLHLAFFTSRLADWSRSAMPSDRYLVRMNESSSGASHHSPPSCFTSAFKLQCSAPHLLGQGSGPLHSAVCNPRAHRLAARPPWRGLFARRENEQDRSSTPCPATLNPHRCTLPAGKQRCSSRVCTQQGTRPTGAGRAAAGTTHLASTLLICTLRRSSTGRWCWR